MQRDSMTTSWSSRIIRSWPAQSATHQMQFTFHLDWSLHSSLMWYDWWRLFSWISKHIISYTNQTWIPWQDTKNEIMTTNMWVMQVSSWSSGTGISLLIISCLIFTLTPFVSYEEWIDYNLRWNPEEYGGLDVFYVPADQIWLPDVVLYNR